MSAAGASVRLLVAAPNAAVPSAADSNAAGVGDDLPPGVGEMTRFLRDQGYEVVVVGYRQSAAAVVMAAVDEDVDAVVCVKPEAGQPSSYVRSELVDAMRAVGAGIPVVEVGPRGDDVVAAVEHAIRGGAGVSTCS